jgi:hypothetical protein
MARLGHNLKKVFMQRYSISTPLVAIRLSPSTDNEKPGVMSSLPSDAIVEVQGRSNLGIDMVEVSWQADRYAVFERDLQERAEPQLVV